MFLSVSCSDWQLRWKTYGGGGFFKSGIVRPTKYTLIFQGRGNNCDNAGDFTNWRLAINGKKASYAFYGKMKASS